jgi:hypothetical protein
MMTHGIQMCVLVVGFTGAMYWLWKHAPSPRTQILAIPIFYILTVVLPIGHAHLYSQKYKSNDILMEDLRFIESRPESERILFVSGNHYGALLTKTNFAFILEVKDNPEVLKEHLDKKHYTDIYFSRRIELKEGSDEFTPLHPDTEGTNPDIFILETVYEKAVTPGVIMQYTRLVDIILPSDDVE